MLISKANQFLRWLPFAVMGIVALIDILAGPRFGYLPLLALGPAFAALSCCVRRTVLVGLLALMLCMPLGAYDHIMGHRLSLLLASITGVTVASALASSGRQKRESELANVRTVAEVTQRVLLRPVPRQAGILRIAVSYTSAAAEARVGGDLYEVITSPSGVRVLVGDVQGKGLEAVETAAAVVGVFREAAYDEPSLSGVVMRLETTLDRVLSGEKFVTAVLAEYDHDQVTLLSCGHPPPLVLRSDGGVHFAELDEPAPPLGLTGLCGSRPASCRLCFDPGDQMLFYTDGVIEARDDAGRFYPLRDRSPLLKAAEAEEALEDLRTDLLRYVGGTIKDDAAMLLIRHC